MNRITPDNITSLEEEEIFVFGSNLAGRHGAGAARAALQWGAVMGEGIGHFGQTYAIPTKDALVLRPLALDEIQIFVDEFILYARRRENRKKIFLVTEIGCGLAGFSVEQIAPLFKEAVDLPNVALPSRFRELLSVAA
jgi:hypothetical protein